MHSRIYVRKQNFSFGFGEKKVIYYYRVSKKSFYNKPLLNVNQI